MYGPLATEDLKAALDSALRRLRAGEHELAIHPRCGTNLATGFVLAGLASSAALSGRRRSPLEKMVQLVVGLGAAFALAKPLGCQLQERVTTSASVGDLRVVKVLRLERGTVVVHRVDTAQG